MPASARRRASASPSRCGPRLRAAHGDVRLAARRPAIVASTARLLRTGHQTAAPASAARLRTGNEEQECRRMSGDRRRCAAHLLPGIAGSPDAASARRPDQPLERQQAGHGRLRPRAGAGQLDRVSAAVGRCLEQQDRRHASGCRSRPTSVRWIASTSGPMPIRSCARSHFPAARTALGIGEDSPTRIRVLWPASFSTYATPATTCTVAAAGSIATLAPGDTVDERQPADGRPRDRRRHRNRPRSARHRRPRPSPSPTATARSSSRATSGRRAATRARPPSISPSAASAASPAR